MLKHVRVMLAGLMLAAPHAFAGPVFDQFTPLPASVTGGSLPESKPWLLGNPNMTQKTISVNNSPVNNGDNWDMITANESGPQAGRYLLSPYETTLAGVRRVDRQAGTTTTIVAPGTLGFVNGDASRWTPFGTYITAEESWPNTAGGVSSKGRLFEINNPLAAPGSISFVNQNIVPRTAKEGFVFDQSNNMYFVDEFNGGGLFKYSSQTPLAGGTFFGGGQTAVLKVGAGGQNEGGGAAITGAGIWTPITDAAGNALNPAHLVNVSDAGATALTPGTAVDGRAAATAARLASDASTFNRPEDLEIQTLANGDQLIYFSTTDAGPGGNGRVYSMNLTTGAVKLFIDRNTINQATGLAVGNEWNNPDNIGIDSKGNIYIVEDAGNIAAGGSGFDVWFAQDADRDGVAESIGRWASLSTVGAEPTGLYFDRFNSHIAYINVQHTASDQDRTIQFTVPEPAAASLVLSGLLAGGIARRRRGRK